MSPTHDGNTDPRLTEAHTPPSPSSHPAPESETPRAGSVPSSTEDESAVKESSGNKPTPAARPLVSIRNLRVTLGGQPILHGLNAEIPRGQVTALIGLNGSGKTTILKAILKEIPYSGSISFHCGHDHSHPLPEQVGYVPQKMRFDAYMPLTVRDLLALSLQKRPLFFGIGKAQSKRFEAMLARVGSPTSLLDKPFEKISGGEQQRVLLALALEPSPELLLLDEPAAGVDFRDQESFYALISRLNRENNVTILLVSHELSVVSKHAHQVLCVKDGLIECQGPPEHVLDRKMLEETFGKEMGLYRHSHDH